MSMRIRKHKVSRLPSFLGRQNCELLEYNALASILERYVERAA